MAYSCDWCEGGATDLIYNKDGTMYGGINIEDGIMKIIASPPYRNETIKGQRQVNFCPMCGRPVGRSPTIKLLKELSRVFGCRVTMDDISGYVGSIGWKVAKDRVSELRYMDNDEILRRYFS